MCTENRSPIALLVEDDWLLREAIAQELRDAGWKVVAAASGEEALDRLTAAGEVCALITDIGLAGKMDGWMLAKIVAERARPRAIVYVSGAEGGYERRVPSSVFIPKPCAPAAVLAAIADLCLQTGCHAFA